MRPRAKSRVCASKRDLNDQRVYGIKARRLCRPVGNTQRGGAAAGGVDWEEEKPRFRSPRKKKKKAGAIEDGSSRHREGR